MKNITQAQRDVLETLDDVASHEGGDIILKNRYHSAAQALIRRGFVTKRDCAPYRPRYQITPDGIAAWNEICKQH